MLAKLARTSTSLRTLLLAAGLAAAASASGCVVAHDRYYDIPPPPPRRTAVTYEDWPEATPGSYATDENGNTVIVESAPPAPRYEVVYESPGVDYVWVGGYWGWHGGWVWYSGHYRHCPPGYAWRGGLWVSSGRGYTYRRGGWVRGGGGGHHR